MEPETRYQRIAREQRERQEAREKVQRKPRPRGGKRRAARFGNKVADRIDGYDRDDLGHSPDY